MARDDVTARREAFIALAHEAMRHLAKQDIFEDASLFDFLDDEADAWNNDTLVAAFERIIRRFVREQWGMDYEIYTADLGGIVPPITGTLHQLGLLDSSEH